MEQVSSVEDNARPRLRDVKTPLRTKTDLKAAFREHNIWTRKDLGQNFLIDHNLLEFLVRVGEVGPDDLVLDVGAGTGLLTRHLAARAWEVWGVEIDRRLFAFCQDYTSDLRNVRLFNQDVLRDKYHIHPELETGLSQELASHPGSVLKVVSNLPYSVSTLVVPNLLQGPLRVERMVVTVQKEVGDRLVAQPGSKDYGSLSVIVQAYAEIEVVRILAHTVFWPQPKVDSAIVRIVPSGERVQRMRDPRWFDAVARGLFSARRKMALNSLRQAEVLGLTEDRAAAAFRRAGIEPSVRGEALRVDQIIDLSNALLEPSA
jgi:16S rRNA (adenine1518-N6/adenine1519-N6)-dimethyltransferase